MEKETEMYIPDNMVAVSQSDTVDETATGILYVGTAGDVKFTTVNDQDVTLTLEDATWLPVKVKRIWSTGTTASDIYICY